MLLDETTLCATCWMHGVFASLLTIGNTSFHRLFSASRDPYNITRAGGLRILIDAGAGWRLLGDAVGLRDGPERLPLDLPPGGAHRHRPGRGLGRRPGDGVAHRRRGRPLPLPRLRRPRPRRARVRPRRARRDRRRQPARSPSGPTRPRSGASATRTRSTISSPARPTRSRRSAATNCSTPTAGRAAAASWRSGRSRRGARLRRRRRAGRPGRGGAARGQVRRAASDEAAILAPAARYWSRVTRSLRLTGDGEGVAAIEHGPALARAERHDPPHRAARARAVRRRRLGHPRRLPGSGRAPARARARRARSGRSSRSSSRSSRRPAATGRNGSCSSPTRRSATGTAMATSSSGR